MLIDYKNHRIFAFSDTHGMYRRLHVPEETDILICAGDACEGFQPEGLRDFFDWYAELPARLRIFVPGNHDRVFQFDPVQARAMIPQRITLLENDSTLYHGILFYGIGTVPAAPPPEGVDFLISHYPAFGHLDRGTGDRSLYRTVTELRPRYHIFGHVHEDGLKKEEMLYTTYLNVSYFEALRRIDFPTDGLYYP